MAQLGGLTVTQQFHNTGVPNQTPFSMHNAGQIAGHVLNALPGYSTLGANITNPNVNYLGVPNPGAPAPAPNYSSPNSTGGAGGGYSPANYSDSAGNYYSSQAAANQASQNLAEFDQGIGNVQSGIDRLGNQLNVGNQNIDSGYNSALNQLLQGEANTKQQYDTSKTQQTQDFVGTKNTIGGNAGNSLNGLQRLLGARGAGGSSAALFGAPQAVAQQAAQQRAGAGQAYGRNQQALDTSWNGYETGVGNSKTDLSHQRDNSRNGLQASIDTTRANLLQSLATLQGQRAQASGGNPVSAAQPYLDQANNYLGQADSLGLQTPTFQVQPTVYQAPTLDHYTANPFATPQTSGNGALDQSVAPYLSLLLGAQKDKQNPLQVQPSF